MLYNDNGVVNTKV